MRFVLVLREESEGPPMKAKIKIHIEDPRLPKIRQHIQKG